MFNDTQACIPNLDFLCILQIYLGFSTAAFLSFAALHTWALRASISSINAVVSSTSLTSFFFVRFECHVECMNLYIVIFL